MPLIWINPNRIECQDHPSMVKREHRERHTGETTGTEEPPREDERRRVIVQYIDDLRERLKRLQRLFS
ncbi:MAG: hypothetical protein JO365_35950 [Bradyrhizobium sp.]|nr:hypothetical protein [Bradyrhizobium sp.]